MEQKLPEVLATLGALSAPPAPEVSPGFDVIAAKLTAEVERLKRTADSHFKDFLRVSKFVSDLRQERAAWKLKAEQARALGPADSVVKDRDGLRLQVSKLMRQVADLEREVGLYREHANGTAVKISEAKDRMASELAATQRTFANMQAARDAAQASREAIATELEKAKADLAKAEGRIKTLTDAAKAAQPKKETTPETKN